MVVCGDFNARCGNLKDHAGDIEWVSNRNSVDMVKTDQGELLVECTCLLSTGLCFVNGHKGRFQVEFARGGLLPCSCRGAGFYY